MGSLNITKMPLSHPTQLTIFPYLCHAQSVLRFPQLSYKRITLASVWSEAVGRQGQKQGDQLGGYYSNRCKMINWTEVIVKEDLRSG